MTLAADSAADLEADLEDSNPFLIKKKKEVTFNMNPESQEKTFGVLYGLITDELGLQDQNSLHRSHPV